EHDHDQPHDAETDGPNLHELARGMKGNPFIHEHGLAMTLDAEDELIPGLAEQLVGAVSGDVRRFTLTIPEDSEDFDDIAGQPVDCLVIVRNVEKQTLPALNDDFAARITAEEGQPLTLLELRMRVRSNLERQVRQNYDNEYATQALDQMVAQASIKYPPVMVEEEIDRILERFDENLKRNGLSLDAYLTIYKRSKDELREEYRETARRNLERSLVMQEILIAEKLRASQADIDTRVAAIIQQYNQSDPEMIRTILQQPVMIEGIVNDILIGRVRERIAAIARGEAPEIDAATGDAADTVSNAEGEQLTGETVEARASSAAVEARPNDDDEDTNSQGKGDLAS
ncbi:MAG: hypothetical protein NZM00_13990, partial [Anaerolinea sp.]|nr:hypothetical protein [Anaerolinea sp.]